MPYRMSYSILMILFSSRDKTTVIHASVKSNINTFLIHVNSLQLHAILGRYNSGEEKLTSLS